MQARIVLVLLGLLSLTSGNAQTREGVSQVVMPKDIYVGDTAEVRYSFDSALPLLQEQSALVTLHSDSHFLEKIADDCLIQSMILQKTNNHYVLTVRFKPWRPGIIDIPAFDLYELIPDEHDSHDSVFVINLEPFTIASLAEKGGYTTLRPVVPPLLMPGTSYLIYGCIILLVILFVLLVRMLLHFQRIITRIKNMIIRMGYRHNAAGAVRELRKIGRLNTAVFEPVVCARIQKIMREYLTYRFAYPFESVTTDKLTLCFNQNIMAGMVSEDQENGIEQLCALFTRCDYIRFAQNSLQQPEIRDKERATLLTMAINCIRFFEGADHA